MGSFFKRVQSNKQLKMAGAEATDDVILAEKTGPPRRTQVLTELKLQVKLAAPVVLGYLLQMMLNMVRAARGMRARPRAHLSRADCLVLCGAS